MQVKIQALEGQGASSLQLTTEIQMKKILLATMIAGAFSASSLAQAANTNTMAVSATILGVCKFQTTTSALAFGSIDPSGTAAATATTNLTYKCTKGTTPTASAITSDNGAHFLTGSKTMTSATIGAGSNLPYTIAFVYTPVVGTGFASATVTTVAVNGSIAATDYQAASAATDYSDSVIISITP
jgi:hypothetical protein